MSVAIDTPRDGHGEDSRVDRYESACAHAPNTALRKYQPKMYVAIWNVLPTSLDSASAALTAALATTLRLTAGAGRADRARGEARGEADRAGGEERGPAQLGAGAVEVPPTAQHRGLASAVCV